MVGDELDRAVVSQGRLVIGRDDRQRLFVGLHLEIPTAEIVFHNGKQDGL